MKVRAQVTLGNKFSANFQACVARIAPRVENGLREGAKTIFLRSQEKVPKDTTALYLSGGIRQEGSGLKAVFIVGYGKQGFTHTGLSKHEGGMVTKHPYDYVVYVHQDLNPPMKHPNGGEAKFLERAISQYWQDIQTAVVVGAA
jgi:hypothetical protein